MKHVRIAAAGVAVAAALLPAAPATAGGDTFLSRTSGFAATTQWTQVLDMTAQGFGNTHVGDLYAYETRTGYASVFAFIDDYDCPPGQLPEGGHGGAGACTYVTSRVLDGFDVPFTVDRKLSSARLAGTLRASTGGHGEPGGEIGQVPADFTWTATGDATRSSTTFRYRDGDTYYSDSQRTTERTAALAGRLGPMLFEQAARASGTIESYRSTSRSSSK